MKKLLLFAAIFIAASLSAQNTQNNSLGTVLNPDGTLNMNAANGSYDVSGFQITSAPNEEPRFMPTAKSNKAAGDEYWTDPFTPSVGVDNEVLAICYMGGTAYIGGKFVNASGMPVNYIASWNGISWKHLVNGLSDQVNCIAASATKIYVGGRFTNGAGIANADYIIEYNPTTSTWAAMGTGMNGYVNSICVNGTNVYAGGSFSMAGGVGSTGYLARWSTSLNTWNSLSAGLNESVSTVAFSGTYLYIGGYFLNAAGIADADYVARYNGTTWSALNTTLFPSAVSCIIPDGSGNVYIGGLFGNLGGNANADGIVKYTSATTLYSAVGTGVSGDVKAMCFDGTTLCVAGNFSSAGGAANTNKIAQCAISTGTWSSIGNGLVAGNNANAIGSYAGDILVGGLFSTIDGKVFNNIAHYNWGTWLTIGSAFDAPILSICKRGNDFYFGGSFTHAVGYNANYFVKWNKISGSWTTYDSLNSSVTSIVVDSTGNLYIAGSFTNASGDINADRIARWDENASNWVSLGSGIQNPTVFDMVAKGNTIFVCGSFADAGGNANCDNIAKWTGTSWASLGSTPPLNVYTTKMYQYGGKVYVGGFFTNAGGVANANYFAAWNTSTNTWEAVGGGADNGVRDIFVDSTGVYIVGDAAIKTSVSADYVARFDGTTWYPIGSGIDDFVETITKRGNDIYISGQFYNAGAGPANMIAHYDGTNWKNMGSGISGVANDLLIDDSLLYVVGNFIYAGGKEIEYAARYQVLPYITAQTTSQAVCTGLPVPLSVTAYGTATLLYQWYFNGSVISGATNNSYTIGSAGASNAGNYYCIVKNDGGSITSSTIIISLQPVLNVGTIAIANTDVCTGSSVQMSVTATGSGTVSYQWQLNASNISGATNSTYTIASASSADQGAYQCIVTDACKTLTAGPTVLYVHALPNITAVASNSIICPGNASTLTASGGSSYIWTPATGLSSTTANPAIASPPASITYTVSGTDSWGCANTNTVAVSVKQPIPEQLCMVTQDTAIKKCVVVWEKTLNAGIKEYKVLRESTTLNVYNLIGIVAYDSLSAFIDTSSHPEAYSHRYRIIAVDTCNNESDTSAFHRTMHLNVNYSGTPGTYNLIWDAYQGFSFPSYEVYRGTTPSSLALIFTLPSSTPSISDGGAPLSGDVYYWVKIVKNDSCVATSAAKASSTTYSTSVSNMEQYKIIGIEEIAGALPLLIYPNPFDNETTISFDNPANTTFTLNVTDVAGRTVLQKTNISGNKYIFNRGGLNAGYYMIELRGDKLYRGRIIIN